MLKIVIEIKRKLIAADAELHADLAVELYDDGSNEDDLFGANIYFEDNDIEWSSTINVKQNVRLAVRQGEE